MINGISDHKLKITSLMSQPYSWKFYSLTPNCFRFYMTYSTFFFMRFCWMIIWIFSRNGSLSSDFLGFLARTGTLNPNRGPKYCIEHSESKQKNLNVRQSLFWPNSGLKGPTVNSELGVNLIGIDYPVRSSMILTSISDLRGLNVLILKFHEYSSCSRRCITSSQNCFS